MNKLPEDDNDRYLRYLRQNKVFFASNTEMEKWAKQQPFLKRITSLVPHLDEKRCWDNEPKSNWYYMHVPIDLEFEDLPNYFGTHLLNIWGIYQFNLEYCI